MRRIKRILRLAAAVLAFAAYVWFAAVRLAPRVKRRKRARRHR
jgi:HAMP domain-containing protein